MASMISHDRQVLFIHIPKTAGSSITYTYRDYFEPVPDDVPTHRRVEDFGIDPKQYWKFTVIRNPWAMCASWFCWYESYLRHSNGPFKTMDNAVREVELPEVFGLQQMDWVIRFERLQEQLDFMMRFFDIPALPLVHLNGSKMGDYRQYYSDGQAEIVAQRFAATIKRFGYEF